MRHQLRRRGLGGAAGRQAPREQGKDDRRGTPGYRRTLPVDEAVPGIIDGPVDGTARRFSTSRADHGKRDAQEWPAGLAPYAIRLTSAVATTRIPIALAGRNLCSLLGCGTRTSYVAKRAMKDTILERDLLPNCSVAAVLERVGQGMEWRSFLDRALKDTLMSWAFDIGTDAAVVGHPTSLAQLDKHISTFARNSYKLTGAAPVSRQRLAVSGFAAGKIKKQSSSADQYAFITIRAEPNPKSRTILLTKPRSGVIPPELHCPELPDANLAVVCLASFGQYPARPIVGFQVMVVEGKWHDVDSYSGVFKRATCIAMSEILREQPVVQ